MNTEKISPEPYSLIGKLYYLSNDFDAASKYFLTALHLEIRSSFEERMRSKDYENISDKILESNQNRLFDSVEKNDERKLLLLFGHSVIHVAHSLADRAVLEQNVSEISLYRKILMGEECNLTENFSKLENKFYFNLGLIFSLSVIDKSLKLAEITTHYFSLESDYLNMTYKESLKLYSEIA